MSLSEHPTQPTHATPSVAELSAALAAGQVSAVELAQQALARARQAESLGAFLAIDEARTLAEAQAADARRQRGEAGPLTGIPLGHKDIFVTDHARSGLPTTAGSRMLAGYRSPFDATVVARLGPGDGAAAAPGAGMVTIGKLNCDEFAMGSSNEHSAFGPVKNAVDNNRVPGGSSGCSAVAVQADMCML